jgi:peptide-methionine (S)-S-oxide reductase
VQSASPVPSAPSKVADPASSAPSGISNKLALGAGCYWGTEKFVKKGAIGRGWCTSNCFPFPRPHDYRIFSVAEIHCVDFQKKFPNSIKYAKVGFMSPDANNRIKNPSYTQVCSGTTGYVEVLYVELNNPEAHFEELVRFFFQFHDPTTKNRQGNDTGFQYSSCIFCGDKEQQKIAQKVKEELQDLVKSRVIRNYSAGVVQTQVYPLTNFVEATRDHQEYLEKNPLGYW